MLVGLKGGSDRRRTACVMVGWKDPPKRECSERWVGRTWPSLKKKAKGLKQGVSSRKGQALWK